MIIQEEPPAPAKTETANCQRCKTRFTRDVEDRWFKKRCDTCQAIDEEEARLEREKRERDQRWQEFIRRCPPLYLKTDRAKLPPEARAAINRIDSYTWGPKGLVFAGPTARGKTRLAWQLLKRLAVEEGKTVAVFDWHECMRLTMDTERLPSWLKIQQGADCLLFDDFGKNKFSDRMEAEIFDLIEQRTSYELPSFFTTNSTADQLRARMSPDRGEPMLRRIQEFCDVIEF